MKLKIITILLTLVGLFGCAHKSITDQVTNQTKDPFKIAQAIMIDAEDHYYIALRSYQTYKPIWKQTKPGLVEDLDELFARANTLLNKWHELLMIGVYDEINVNTFKNFRMSILRAIAHEEGIEIPNE